MEPRILSIFADESGDFGPYSSHSPYYILGLVFHEQSDDITESLEWIYTALANKGLSKSHAIHTGPLVRREEDYAVMNVDERRSIFRALVDFVRKCDITHEEWVFQKRQFDDSEALLGAMARDLGIFLRDNLAYFSAFDQVIIYYDGGQREITRLVNSVFNAYLVNVEVRKVSPTDYSLFQAVDLCCTMALLEAKMDAKRLTKSERVFFTTTGKTPERSLRLGYLKTIASKKFQG